MSEGKKSQQDESERRHGLDLLSVALKYNTISIPRPGVYSHPGASCGDAGSELG